MSSPHLKFLFEQKSDHWVGTCLDFNIVVVEANVEKAFFSLKEAVCGYLNAVVDTEDKLSIPSLLRRPSPLRKRIIFWIVEKKHNFKKWKAMTFDPKPTHSFARCPS